MLTWHLGDCAGRIIWGEFPGEILLGRRVNREFICPW